MRRKWVWFAVAVCFSSGCADFREYAENQLVGARNDYLAAQAWREIKCAYQDVIYRKHFGRGFRQGYLDVTSGGNGCPPILPPRRYWSISYQNPEGHRYVQMWFDGYHEGVIAAERDGVANWSEIPTWCRGDECERRREQIVTAAQEAAPVEEVNIEEGFDLDNAPPPPGEDFGAPPLPPGDGMDPTIPDLELENLPPSVEVPAGEDDGALPLIDGALELPAP